jgi:ribonuclease R
VSRAQRQRHEPVAGRGRTPAPGAVVVAVLERRGRFLAADPLFGPNEGDQRPLRSRGARIAIRPSDAGGAGAGDLVLVGLGARSSARVLRVLGRPDVARDLIEGLMLDRGLRRGFAPEVERQARDAAERVAAGGQERRDLRSLPTFTIDPISARDFDDAVSAEALPDGAARVWVHIADVAAHVPAGSALDLEARRRSTSVYVPGAVEPMLPHALSSEACSLLPGVDRAAVTAELEFDGGRPRRAAFYRSLIRSDANLDYERVDRIFAGSEVAASPWGEPLRITRELAGALARQREQRGGLVVESSEPEFVFDEHGGVSGIHARTQTESHRLIEHLMIAANEAVAELLVREHGPALYRVHERPEPQRVERLVDQLASLGVATPPVPEPMSSTQAADLLAAISAAVERHVGRTHRGGLALGALVLRSLKQAYYSPQNLGHAGLHSSAYCHFTSPIRRYPDIVCHRSLLSLVGARETAHRPDGLAELGAWSSERERDATRIERDGDDVARCFALASLLRGQDPGRSFAGEVTGLIGAGAFIAFGDRDEQSPHAPPPFEGMLPARLLRAGPTRTDGSSRSSRSALRDARARGRGGQDCAGREGHERDWWELNEQGTILRGARSGRTVRLGEEIEVAVAHLDTVRGRVELRPAG